MLHKIDYVGYSYKNDDIPLADTGGMLLKAFRDALPDYLAFEEDWTAAPYRRYYSGGYCYDNHTYVWFNRKGHILVEHTGKGCDWLEAHNLLMLVAQGVYGRITRLDVATDILSPVRPSAFVKRRGEGRHTSEKYELSGSGESWLVGSRDSDRHAVVYRYDDPHPRKDFLRIEYRYRAEQARVVSSLLKDTNIQDVALKSAETYKWKHHVWKMEKSPKMEEIKAYRPDRKQSKTTHWILTQCVPAIARMIREGEFTLEEITREIEKATQA